MRVYHDDLKIKFEFRSAPLIFVSVMTVELYELNSHVFAIDPSAL